METTAPVVAQMNYQLQPIVTFNGTNWATFHAAFINYARQQGFYAMLGEEGAEEPENNAQTWRQRMAQATIALVVLKQSYPSRYLRKHSN